MKKIAINSLLGLVVASFLFCMGCADDVKVTPAPIIPPDTVLPILGSEIGYSAVFDGQSKDIENFDKYKGNGVDSSWNMICGTPFDAYKRQEFHFGNFKQAFNQFGITFNIYKCNTIYNDSIEKDSMIVPGNYTYGNSLGLEGVTVTWVDDTNGVFSSDLAPNIAASQANSTFNITDVVRNQDGFSRFLIAGTFSCVLFNTNGDSVIVTDGQFVSRAGRDY